MKKPLFFVQVLLAVLIFNLSVGKASAANCPSGSVSEQDLAKGELILDDTDLVKIRLSDQKFMNNASNGRAFFSPANHHIVNYHLESQKGRRWMVVQARGMFGRSFREANLNFANHTHISGSYFPATRKAVISVMTPSVHGSKTYAFWVFLRVPNEFLSIAYDCGTFK